MPIPELPTTFVFAVALLGTDALPQARVLQPGVGGKLPAGRSVRGASDVQRHPLSVSGGGPNHLFRALHVTAASDAAVVIGAHFFNCRHESAVIAVIASAFARKTEAALACGANSPR